MVLILLLGFRWHTQRKAPTQPIEFSHEIHVGKLNLQCLFCHETADKSTFAGVPSVQKCMELPHRRQDRQPGDPEAHQVLERQGADALESRASHSHSQSRLLLAQAPHRRPACSASTVTDSSPRWRSVRQVKSFKMGWCVSCHEANHAPTDCVICHRNVGLRKGTDTMDRREFLGLLTLASGASLLAGCDLTRKSEKLIPYLVPPDDGILPGQATFIATSCTECPANCGDDGAHSRRAAGQGGRQSRPSRSTTAPCAFAARPRSRVSTRRSHPPAADQGRERQPRAGTWNQALAKVDASAIKTHQRRAACYSPDARGLALGVDGRVRAAHGRAPSRRNTNCSRTRLSAKPIARCSTAPWSRRSIPSARTSSSRWAPMCWRHSATRCSSRAGFRRSATTPARHAGTTSSRTRR